MKLAVLMENTSYKPGFASEHGLSLYIETKKHKILFDTGQSSMFGENAVKLGIDLKNVDIAFLSHGHYDHGGGLQYFFELNDHAPVYLNEDAFDEHYHGTNRYIGLNQSLRSNDRLIRLKNDLTIDNELSLCTCNTQNRPFPNSADGLTTKIGNEFIPDNFSHEQYVILQDEGRSIVLSGCSHKGILNIVEWLHPDIFIGGFHLMNVDLTSGKNSTLDKTAECLTHLATQYYTCHCTGIAQYQYLKKSMNNKLCYLSAGQVIRL